MSIINKREQEQDQEQKQQQQQQQQQQQKEEEEEQEEKTNNPKQPMSDKRKVSDAPQINPLGEVQYTGNDVDNESIGMYPSPKQYDMPNSGNARLYDHREEKERKIGRRGGGGGWRAGRRRTGRRVVRRNVRRQGYESVNGGGSGYNNGGVEYESDEEFERLHPRHIRLEKSKRYLLGLQIGLWVLLAITIVFFILLVVLLFYSSNAVSWISLGLVIFLGVLIIVIIVMKYRYVGSGSLFIDDLIFTNIIWGTFVVLSIITTAIVLTTIYKQASENFFTLFNVLPLGVKIVLIVLFVSWLASIVILIFTLSTHNISRHLTLKKVRERIKTPKQESET